MLNIAVMISGGGTNLQAIIDGIRTGVIKNAGIRVVISNRRDAYGLERARQAGIENVVVSPRDYPDREDFHQALLDTLDAYEPDLIVLAGCLLILPPQLVEKYKNRIINIHPSLIPSFCGQGAYGLKVHQMALDRGVKITGATCHFVDAGTDTGPIIDQKAVEVLPDDTPESLQRRVMEQAEWKIMPRAIDDIANGRIQVKDGKVCRIQN